MAEKDKNSEAMIKYAMEIIGETRKGSITKSVKLIRKAHKLYTDDFQVIEFYVRIMFIHGHIVSKIGDFEGAYNTLRDVIHQIDILKRHNYKPSEIRVQEIDACFGYVELAYGIDEHALVSSMLDRTAIQKYPYAYECIQKYATIDSELAAYKLRKYSKGFWGKITYRNWMRYKIVREDTA